MSGRSNAESDTAALKTLQPRKLLLTQFDLYRRYQPVLARLAAQPGLVGMKITDTAQTPPPDAFKSWQRVVQHISWAPVIVDLDWK
jgi:hypothetical protein